MDLLRHLTPILLIVTAASEVASSQSHDFKKIEDWHGGIKFQVCFKHYFKIDCGWEMELIFSGPLTTLEHWSVALKSKTSHKNGVRYLLGHLHWNKKQPSPACHTFIARYKGDRPHLDAAAYTRTCNNGVWTDHIASGNGCNCPFGDGPSKPIVIPTDLDYETKIRTQWNDNNGNHIFGEICLFHTALITCGFDADIVISAPIRAFQIWTASIVDEFRTKSEFLYKISNLQWATAQELDVKCHNFQLTYKDQKPKIIAGRYTRACHLGIDNFSPNKGATPYRATVENQRHRFVLCHDSHIDTPPVESNRTRGVIESLLPTCVVLSFTNLAIPRL